MQDFSCTTRAADGLVVIETGGEVDLAVADRWWSEIEGRVVPGARVVLRLADVTFLDSMGLRVLAKAGDRAKESGAELTLAECSDAVLRVLDLAGLDGVFAMAGPEILPPA
jgi:anti-anti-sigma factor